ncbi:hypothetical protein HGP28_06130 [Vibrio sp. SM6]|uniref:Uncharacterized protein n=1 Tax=Vibrio agarilyticus TaxID=2726741 RepID=A0A7X8TPB8_9VIBR|nr:hypothetical protein [Vibrio agarilyticus]NLS12477.1 hypothetical protein [Vibrio agarilyticus]
MKINSAITLAILVAGTALLLTSFSVIQMERSLINHALEKNLYEYEAFYRASLSNTQTTPPSVNINELEPHWLTSPHNINLSVKNLEWAEFFNPNLNTKNYRTLLLEESIRLRPTWPSTYFELHQTLQGSPSELGTSEQVLSLGARFGPFEPSVNFTYVERQLERWKTLSFDERATTLEQLGGLLKAYYTHDELRGLIAKSTQIHRICSTTQFYNIWIPECY